MKSPKDIIEEKGWIQVSDENAIKDVVHKILEENTKNENKTEKLEMIVYKKENIFIKIFNKIKRFFRIK